MELNVCLYCEKRLLDDNMAFCSVTCQSKEASKSINESYAFIQVQQQPNKSNNTSTMHSSVGPGNYQMSYHRSPSLSYTRKDSPYVLMQSISSSTSFSSSISDISVISCDNICPPYHITRTTT